MAIIIDRSSGAETDKILSCNNEQIARSINVGSSWMWLRIALRFEISQSAALTDIISPKLAFGLTAGTSSLYGFSSTNHYVGFSQNTADNLSYSGFYQPGGAYNGGTQRIITKVGATETAFRTGMTFQIGTFLTPAAKKRNVMVLDFIKTNADPGLWSIRSYTSHFLTFNNNDVSSSVFYSEITNETSSWSDVDIATTFVPVSESINGSLDTINIYWNKSVPPIEISDVAVFRFL